METVRRPLALLCCGATIVALACAGPSAEAQYGEVTPPVAPPAGAPPPLPGYGVPDGQWVYTQQYGWIWMTTGEQYTYVPPDGTGEPLEYVYYGNYGWTWIAAPWVWGYGPRPYWGRARPDRFAWYRHGYWREPRRWHYTAAPERGEVGRRGMRAPPPARAPVVQGRGGERPPAVQGRGGERRGEGRGREGGAPQRGEREGGGREGGGGNPPQRGER
jgi:hypothetical protein